MTERATISSTNALLHPALPGVQVFPFEPSPMRGKPQQVLVVAQPGTVIPMHRHDTSAEMFVVSGSANVLSEDLNAHGREVVTGDRVFFVEDKLHGFEVGPTAFAFVSTNGGIVDEAGDWAISMAA